MSRLRRALWLCCVALSAGFVSPLDAHDLTKLPLGDGRISHEPRVGWVWPCHIEPNAGGAWRDGDWIDKRDGTYDFTRKAVVPGDVSWPAKFAIELVGDRRVFTSNDLPSHGTGIFPIPSDSAAYRYDTNPNRIAAQRITISLPANPQLAESPTCAPPALGILLSGAVLFNALDAPGRDAVAHETQDKCQGHPQEGGVYHYHSVSTCVDTKRQRDGHSALVGYMLDGFGIYGRYGEGGKLLTSKDLDACHGHTHLIEWDGHLVRMYHYHATWDFPYTAGCMRGTVNMRDVMALSGPVPPHRDRQFADAPGQNGSGRPGDLDAGRGPRGPHPDLNRAARQLGIDVDTLRRALGPPPPDLRAAARQLGIDEQRLRAALDASR